jgi:hypothetical protein
MVSLILDLIVENKITFFSLRTQANKIPNNFVSKLLTYSYDGRTCTL